MHFRVDGSSAEIYTSFISYDADTKIATCKLLIDDSVSSGTWKLFDISVRDYYNNYKSYHSHELDTEMVEALSLEVVGNGTEITAPVIKDVYIANPKDSYTEGDQVYINVLLEEESDLDFAKLTFASGNGGKLISEYCTSYNPTTKIASFRFLIDESVIDGTWKFFSINVCDYYGNYVLYYSFDSEAAFLQDFSFKVDNTKEKDSPSSPDDFFTYDWIGCADSKPTVSLTSSTNQLYTMVVLPGSAASDVTITHTGSSSIIIGSWGRFTEGYELKFPVPGVYKLKFVQNVTNDTLYYYANITDHAVETIIEGKAPTCSETGLTEGKKCGSCGKIFVTQEIIPVTAHNWDQGIVTTQPTETSEGVLTYRCTNCSEIKTEVIDKLEHVHNYVAVITNPTCTEDGYTTHTCSGCGDYYVDSYVSATGHSFSYTENEGLKIGACQNCNAKVEQFGAPSWRLENNKLVGAEYTTGQVMIALYGENGRLIKAKFCWKGEAKTIDGLTLYRYKAPTFTKSDLAQAKQVLCFNFTEQYSPIRDVIEVFR